MADLQELFARIKNQSTDPSHAPAQSHASPQPSLWAQQQPPASSALFSPPISTANPVNPSNIISPINPGSTVGSPGPDTQRTNTLLSLLKFNGQPGQQQGQAGAMANLQNVTGGRHSSMQVPKVHSRDPSQSRPLSAADLVSNLQRHASASGAMSPSPMAAAGAEKTPPQGNQQDFLLGLLNSKSQQPQAQAISQAQAPFDKVEKHDTEVETLTQSLANSTVGAGSQGLPPRESTPARQFGSSAGRSTPFEAPQPTKTPVFNYVNPFDELDSSSPLNQTPKPEQKAEVAQTVQPKKIEILKHNRDISSSQNGDSAAPASKVRKTETENKPVKEVPEVKSQQSVSKALENAGEKVNKQAEQALNQAIKKETADDDVESSWESAEDTNKEDSKVDVYTFPMKPFISLQIKPTKPARPIRQDNLMIIAQLKKEFDQIDRCLVTASQTHIVYAQVATKRDNGGFRIIRQDSGEHKQVFRSSGERIFSVQLCNVAAAEHDIETVLGTGVNGTVFWTSLAKGRGDLFRDDDVEAQGFFMPPVTTAEESTSGSPVKTRAKMSCRHPDYFAVARGKQIFIVAPEAAKDKAYCDATTRKINSEKYFSARALKINTGKAGKDFCFSEDDTIIASLDKNGRVKFWDVRDLTFQASYDMTTPHEPIELRDPLWTLSAAASGSKPDEKPSVSSILFLDRDRIYTKNIALRYLLIGYKQNHILQLWDLGLGKAVQEIRLPHERDSDGICSIGYHPKTGIVAIGHPTRNSVYFVHLSAPKYTLPSIDEATYIGMLASEDPKLPKVDSTAILSGLREFSFAKVGQLRSVDMLRTPVENASERDGPDETLFELYAMHSKGVVGISIKRDDLGWDASGKMTSPKDGVKEGVIEVGAIIVPQKSSSTSEQSSVADTASKGKSSPSKKPEPPKQPATPKVEIKKEPVSSPAPATNGTRHVGSAEVPTKPTQASANPPFVTPDSYSLAAQRAKSPKPAAPAAADAAAAAKNSIPAPKATPAVAPIAAQEDLQALLGKQFDSLFQRLETDKRVQEAHTAARQDALLRLVSETLNDNVDRSLNSIIATRIEKDVIPAIADVTSKVIDRKIAESLPQQLNASVSAALKASLSNALAQALKDKEVHRTISEITANSVATKVQHQVSTMLQQSLPGMATQAAQKMVADVEKRISQQLQHAEAQQQQAELQRQQAEAQQKRAEAQRQQDNAKIEELSSIVRSFSTMVQNMATSQSAFQEQILRMQKESRAQADSAKSPHASSASAAPDPQVEAEDAEVAEITQMLVNGRYEDATIKWISSSRQAEIFDKLFIRVNPDYLQQVSPLVALTVSAAITSSFDTHVMERLDWLGRVLNRVDMRDGDIRDVAPKIMDVLSQRLSGAYMAIGETNPNDPALRTISALNRQVGEIRRLGD